MDKILHLIVNVMEFLIKGFCKNRFYARFYVLETISRVPYFAYLSVLHLYESLGFLRNANVIKIHFAESWNELHHLRIAEALGGGKLWIDRAIARIIVLAYYWILVFAYMISPKVAYRFNQLVEEKAYNTYDNFIKQYETYLKTQPAPEVALKYYRDGDIYMFDDFQPSHLPGDRRPKIENLYDVFVAIRNDEKEHISTMISCQQPEAMETLNSAHDREVNA